MFNFTLMRQIIFMFFMICALNFKAQKGVQTVLNNMREQQTSWNSGDVKGFMKHYWQNDSLKFIGSKGITYGWQKTLNNYLKAYPTKEAMGQLKFSIIEASKLSKSSVYIIGKWELQKEKPVSGHFTLLWKKIKGSWVIVSDHTS